MSKNKPVQKPEIPSRPKLEDIKNYEPNIRKGIVFEGRPTPPPPQKPKEEPK